MDKIDSRNPNPIHFPDSENREPTFRERMIFASGVNAGVKESLLRVQEWAHESNLDHRKIWELQDLLLKPHSIPPTNIEICERNEESNV